MRDGRRVRTVRITRAEQRVALGQRVGAGGYVRVELRGSERPNPANPLAGRLDMEALTNPIFLRPGRAPRGPSRSETAPPG